MRQLISKRKDAIFTIALILLLLTRVPVPALAASPIKGCLPNVGSKVPILMVPGFGGDASKAFYQSGGLQSVLNNVPGIYADSNNSLDAFDYSAHPTDWVNTVNTGQALERTIACMAQSSREGHGPGKVIVIGYSMGGLLVRYAVSQTLNGESIADDVGYIINIAVPNRGVDLASVGFGLLKVVCAFKSIPLNGLLFKPSNQSLATYCLLTPDIKDFEFNLNSPTNSLPDIPVSIPVYDIEGNVKAPLSFIFQNFPTLGTDLLVSVLSAHSQENTLDNGLGGDLVVQCTSKTPVLYISGANCDHLGMSHYAPVEKEVVTQIAKYLNVLHPPLPSPCPASAGTCLGTRSGDVDGDGLPDKVGVTYPSQCLSPGAPCKVTVRVVLATGQLYLYSFQVSTATGPVNNVSYLGLTNMLGDKRSEIFLTYSGCSSGCGRVYSLEYLHGSLQPIPFYGGGNGLRDDNGGLPSGFTCRLTGGNYQVVTFISEVSFGTDGPAIEDVYQSDGNGGMRFVSEQTVSLTAAQASVLNGAHCPGLSVS